MTRDVPQFRESFPDDSPKASRSRRLQARRNRRRAGGLVLGLLSTLLYATSALGATATVGLGSAGSFSVLAGSTVTNTGPTTLSADLGLSPGSSVTGAPEVLGQTHIDDAVAIEAKNALTTAYNNAASRPSNGSAGTDLASQVFLPGVRTASSSLLLSSGTVTLNAQGNPDAVFIFQIGSTLTTGSNTAVSLINGAQACNVFWEVGSSATLGTGTRFVGTVMASTSITADTAATIQGRLLAQTGAVTLDTNSITTSSCATTAGGGGTETIPPTGTAGLGELSTGATPGSSATGTHHRTHRHVHKGRKRVKRPPTRTPAKPPLPHVPSGFTG
jgi:hypothetical protein